jgi:hypothetical protein
VVIKDYRDAELGRADAAKMGGSFVLYRWPGGMETTEVVESRQIRPQEARADSHPLPGGSGGDTDTTVAGSMRTRARWSMTEQLLGIAAVVIAAVVGSVAIRRIRGPRIRQ